MDIVDFHAHVLPRADHGSSSLEDSLRQLELAKECGVTRIVATPHFYPHRDSVESFLARRDAAYRRLAGSLDNSVEIIPGAEVLLCDNLESLPGFEKLCVSGTKTLLLELPFSDFTREHYYSVCEILKMGLEVVLAHVDRYPPENIEQLLGVGAAAQINVDSLASFGKRKKLYEWLERKCVVAIGSDIHGPDKRAYKRFLAAKKKISAYLESVKAGSDRIWNSAKMHSDGETQN